MANSISKIKIPSGTVYEVKDNTSRGGITDLRSKIDNLNSVVGASIERREGSATSTYGGTVTILSGIRLKANGAYKMTATLDRSISDQPVVVELKKPDGTVYQSVTIPVGETTTEPTMFVHIGNADLENCYVTFMNPSGLVNSLTCTVVIDTGTAKPVDNISKKLDKPSAEGTAGQVVASDGNGGTEWVNMVEVSAEATQLPEGSSPTVTSALVSGVPTLTFGIPAGATGAPGAKGDRGDTVIIAKDYADLTFPVYAGKTYCYYDNKPYVANTDIATTEAWTAVHWDEVSFEDEIGDLKSAVNKLITTEETVTPTITLEDGYVKSDGTITGSGSTWQCCDYIDVSEAKNHTVTVKSCIYGTACTVWFASDESVIGYISGSNASDYGLESKSDPQIYNLTLPSNAKYIRVSWYKPSFDAQVDIQISYAEEITAPGEYLAALMDEKIDIDQDSTNAGKVLAVGNDGNVIPVSAPWASQTEVESISDRVDGLIEEENTTVTPTITLEDGYVKTDGSVTGSGSTWQCCDYTDVSEAKDHEVAIKSCIYGSASTVWFTAEKTVIGYITGSNASDYGLASKADPQTYTITLPINAKYIRVSWYKPTFDAQVDIQVSYIKTITATGKYLEALLDEKIDVNQGSQNAGKVLSVGDDGTVEPVSSPWAADLAAKADKADADMLESIVGDPEYMNLVDPSKITASTYINGATGARTASNYYKSSDYMLLKANTLYYVGDFYISSSTPMAYMAFYSSPSESDFISSPSVTLTRSADDHCTILVGASDVYVRLSALNVKTNLYVSAYVDYYVAYSGPITLKEMVTPKCRFKKILVLGDSISTDNYGDYKKWVTDLIDEGFFPSDVVNSSQHASGFVARYNAQPNDFITRLTSISNPETYDLVITFGGINDANQLVPMGEETDTDYTTYFGAAVRYYYKYLCTNFINARIATLLPLPCSTQNRDSSVIGVQYTYSDYQKSVCEAYSLPVLDLTNHGGFHPDANKPGIDYNAAQAFRNRWTLQVGDYNPDGIHPTEEYEKKFLAPMIKAFIESL